MQVLIATTNSSKVDRVRKMLEGTDSECLMLPDVGLPVEEVEEGSDIVENARRKALVYKGRTDLPILGLDSAFVIEGEDTDPAMVKRNALGGRDPKTLSQEEIAQAMVEYYRALVHRRGGSAPAAWEDAFALVLPDGAIRQEHSHRPVMLTGEVRGRLNPYLPLRSMYIVGPTKKYVADQTKEDEVIELQPYKDALHRLLKI